MSDVDFREAETTIAEWRPSFMIFLRKLLFVAILTTLALGVFAIQYGVLIWLIGLPTGLAVYLVIFDDHTEWLRRRKDVWLLTDQRLILTDSFESEPPAYVDLAEIEEISTWTGWAVKLRLINGQSTTMSFLRNADDVRRQILAARAAWIEAQGA